MPHFVVSQSVIIHLRLQKIVEAADEEEAVDEFEMWAEDLDDLGADGVQVREWEMPGEPHVQGPMSEEDAEEEL